MLAFGDWLSGLDSESVRMIAFIAAAAIVAIVWFVSYAWRRARESDNRAQLTAMMLERNMSTDEIERILKAGVGSAEAAGVSRRAKREAAMKQDPEAHLIQHLAELSYEGGDVERILSAARTMGPVDVRTAGIVEGLADQWMETDDIVRILNAHKSQPDGPIDAGRLSEALRAQGVPQKQIDLVLAKTA